MPLFGASFNGGTITNPLVITATATPKLQVTPFVNNTNFFQYGVTGGGNNGFLINSRNDGVGVFNVQNNSGTEMITATTSAVNIPGGSLFIGATAHSSADLILRRSAAATLQFGAADVNGAAVAQITQVQSAVTGTDQNGANWTFIGSKQTGAGTPGDIIFQTSVKLGTGTTQGTPETGLTITGAILDQKPSVVIGNAALATDATEGFLYIPTCAGTPTGTPTARTGRVALIYDTTNDQFWIYDAGWKQPKTPAGAAIVTWQ